MKKKRKELSPNLDHVASLSSLCIVCAHGAFTPILILHHPKHGFLLLLDCAAAGKKEPECSIMQITLGTVVYRGKCLTFMELHPNLDPSSPQTLLCVLLVL